MYCLVIFTYVYCTKSLFVYQNFSYLSTCSVYELMCVIMACGERSTVSRLTVVFCVDSCRPPLIWISASRARRARYCGKLSQCGFDSPQFVQLVSDSEIDSLKRAVESLMTSNTEKVSNTLKQSPSAVANSNVRHFSSSCMYVAYTGQAH